VHCRKVDAIIRVPKFLQFDSWFIQYAHRALLESRRAGEIRTRTSENCFEMGVSGVGRESVDCMYVCGSRRYMRTIRDKCICKLFEISSSIN
jgi:hypothetical protein